MTNPKVSSSYLSMSMLKVLIISLSYSLHGCSFKFIKHARLYYLNIEGDS